MTLDSEPASGSAAAVLVAEADSTRRIVLRWLLDHDHRFVVLDVVDTGEQVASYPGNPDVLIVDLALPGLNAYEAVRRFRSAHPASRVVVLAPVESPYLLHAMAAAGADDYVVAGTPDAHLLDRLGGRGTRSS
jgi:two-component system response regulator DesR